MKTILIDQHKRIYFTDRYGKKVYTNVEDPQMYLNMRQKERYFMGMQSRFQVPPSVISNLERLINWPV